MKRISIHYCLLVMLVLFSACKAGKPQELESATLVVVHGVVIDGTGTDPIPDGFVAMGGNRIVAVGKASDIRIPDEAVVIDADGGTILPGIFNAHSHKDMGAGTRRILFLLDGVTSACDMMIPIPSMHHLDETGIQAGPAARGFKAGPMITAPGGYPGVIFGLGFSYEIDGVEEAKTAVQDINTMGADYIKVALEPGIFGDPWPVLTLEELRAVIETAHSYGLLVRTHVNNAVLDRALEAGVDVIEHVPLPSFAYDDLAVMFDDEGVFHIPPKLENQLLRMIAQGIVLVPTLDVMIQDPDQGEAVDTEAAVINQAILEVVRFFHDSGGIMALGNDYGNAGVKPGMPLREMELLQAVGLSPMEVIVSATQHAAYVCGQSDALGTLEVGKLADVIIVDGNPLEDLNAMDSVLYIVKDGEIVLSPEVDDK